MVGFVLWKIVIILLLKTFVFVFNKRIHFFIGKKPEKRGKIIFSIIWSVILSNVMLKLSSAFICPH